MKQQAINAYKKKLHEPKAYFFKSLSSLNECGWSTDEIRYYVKLLLNPELMDDFIFFANKHCGLTHSNCSMDKFQSVIRQYQETLNFA